MSTTEKDTEGGWEDDFESPLGVDTAELPGRPRRRWLTPWTGALCAVLIAAAGFYAGVRVEKGQLSSGSAVAGALGARFSAGSAGGGLARALSGLGARAGALSGRAGAAAAGGAFGTGAAFGAGGATVGTISAVKGSTLYVTEVSGNTVEVQVSSATKITRNETVGKAKLYPGDTVVISGVTGSGNAISATSVSDQGNRSAGTGSAASSSTSSSSGATISSLFGGG